LSIVDLRRTHKIENAQMASPCGWTPFDGMTVTGWPAATIVRGKLVMRDGEILGPPIGRPVSFRS
jgi:dihydroorotase